MHFFFFSKNENYYYLQNKIGMQATETMAASINNIKGISEAFDVKMGGRTKPIPTPKWRKSEKTFFFPFLCWCFCMLHEIVV